MYVKEFWRNGGGTAENCYLPPKCFLPFLTDWDIFESFETNLLLFFFAFVTIQLNWSQVSITNVRLIFWRNVNGSQIFRKWPTRLHMVVFGGSGCFAAVSSQSLNTHQKSNCHSKYQCFNSLFGLIPALFLRSCNTTPPLLKNNEYICKSRKVDGNCHF